MNHDEVTELLKDFRSYKYATKNCGPVESVAYDFRLPPVYGERNFNPNVWDATRYNRIVNMIEGAVNEVLSDDQRTVIMRKYFDRNPLNLNQIADAIYRDRKTVERWHREAIKRLGIALQPLTAEEREINNFDHTFDPAWKYVEPA